MQSINYKMEMALWVFLILPVIYLAWVWNSLPATVPIHFDMDGSPNGWASKPAEFILIGANLFVYFFTFIIRRVDPKKLTEDFYNNNLLKIRAALTVFLSIISVMVIHAALPEASHTSLHWIPACGFLFIAVLGNFMINLKPNWFLGIRTPWTLSSDIVWRKTHQVGGRIWFYGGLACVALTFLLQGDWLNKLAGTFIFGSTGFFFAYSFWLFKQEEKRVKE